MGYTHYFSPTEKTDPDLFPEFAEGVQRLITQATLDGLDIASADGEVLGAWIINDELISFNGYGPESHETFYWERYPTERYGSLFNFCKTAYKPYDALVVACLVLMNEVYDDTVNISSDGTWEEWQAGRTLFKRVFGRTARPPKSLRVLN